MQVLGTIDWKAIFSSVSVVALGIGAVSWALKAVGEQYLKKRFREYEKQLEAQTAALKLRFDLQLETLKSELNLLQSKNSRLHEKRMLVLESLYQKIVALNDAMREMTAEVQFLHANPVEEERARVSAASAAYHDFLKHYTESRIFFSLATCAQIDTLQNKYFNSLLKYQSQRYLPLAGDTFYSPEQAQTASDTIRRAVPPVLRLIEQDFRALLGVQE